MGVSNRQQQQPTIESVNDGGERREERKQREKNTLKREIEKLIK